MVYIMAVIGSRLLHRTRYRGLPRLNVCFLAQLAPMSDLLYYTQGAPMSVPPRTHAGAPVVSVRLPRPELAALDQEAARTGRTRTAVIRSALARALAAGGPTADGEAP